MSNNCLLIIGYYYGVDRVQFNEDFEAKLKLLELNMYTKFYVCSNKLIHSVNLSSFIHRYCYGDDNQKWENITWRGISTSDKHYIKECNNMIEFKENNDSEEINEEQNIMIKEILDQKEFNQHLIIQKNYNSDNLIDNLINI